MPESGEKRMQYIFVHGLSGWGSYDAAYRRMPYWGMRGGDLMAWLREQGFDCRAASVAPTGSAWDRASKMRHRASVRNALRPDRRLHRPYRRQNDSG